MGRNSQWLSKSRELERYVLGQSTQRHRLDDNVLSKTALAL
jgi:hypothetical protein